METTLDPAIDQAALFELLVRLGDNSLILGHRVSEWCGHSPVLEEDIALANTALDLIGQTRLWLGLAGQVEGKGRSADDLAYLRDGYEFRNILLVERPNGDFGKTLMRQFLFDAWHYLLLKALKGSSERRIADIAEKAFKEVSYHLDRSRDLIIGLGDGTAESHRRMQEALDELWPYTGEMFVTDAAEEGLVASGVIVHPQSLKAGWDEIVSDTLSEATLKKPMDGYMHKGGRRGVHTEHLGYILSELQFLQRAYPGAVW
jgi:ring-1,2-phenylacetyl-CoA epoxidase subunit PaaC